MMMVSAAKTTTRVFVVDASPTDYAEILHDAAQGGYELQVFDSGRAALRRDPSLGPEMWVVNMRLPDMAGSDLLSMLRWRYPGVPVVLVSDKYSAQDEISARCSGAEMYLSKPLRGEWLMTSACAAC
jgi:DNA-binding response OmpR family regulator